MGESHYPTPLKCEVFVPLLPEQALFVAPTAIFDVEDLGGSTFLFEGALGLRTACCGLFQTPSKSEAHRCVPLAFYRISNHKSPRSHSRPRRFTTYQLSATKNIRDGRISGTRAWSVI